MQDKPHAELIIAEVAKALNDGLDAGFPQKVAANALGIAYRELTYGPGHYTAEMTRLRGLLERDGGLDALNTALAEAIETGSLEADEDRLLRHLISTTLEKISVDQPRYPSYKAWKEGAD